MKKFVKFEFSIYAENRRTTQV